MNPIKNTQEKKTKTKTKNNNNKQTNKQSRIPSTEDGTEENQSSTPNQDCLPKIAETIKKHPIKNAIYQREHI